MSRKFKIGDKVKLTSEFISTNAFHFTKFTDKIGIITNINIESIFPYEVKFASYNPKYFKASELKKVEE